MGKNAGRSTTGEAAVPYYLRSPAQEAAKHLRLTAARFLSERATVGDVDEAIKVWHEATGQTAPKTRCDIDKIARRGIDHISQLAFADVANAEPGDFTRAQREEFARGFAFLAELTKA